MTEDTYGLTAENRNAYLVAVATKTTPDEINRSLDELEDLAKTCAFDIRGRVIQNLDRPIAATYIGRGKLDEITRQAENDGVGHLIFDTELTPAQFRNIASQSTCAIHDRTGVILAIFSAHARTDEGKIQVELARLRYRLTRLTGKGVELSRLGGGIGTRGPGETKLEQDRRVIGRRIARLRRSLADLCERRAQHRSRREQNGMPVAAVVGYTNAGKSTLINALCGSEIETADRLFMTLDPTARRLELKDGLAMVLVDTVGFIRCLPATLKEAFRATLEEVSAADLILHVVDGSDPEALRHKRVVDEQLTELGAGGLDRLLVLNKTDRLCERAYHDILREVRRDRSGPVVSVSALTGKGLDALRDRLTGYVEQSMVAVEMRLPYKETALLAYMRENGLVDEVNYAEDGLVVRGRMRPRQLGPLKPFL